MSSEQEHLGCSMAYENMRKRAEFAEARLAGFTAEVHSLAHLMDGLEGTVHEQLGRKTLGGAVRGLLHKGL